MNQDELSRELRARIVAGELPSRVLRPLVKSPGRNLLELGAIARMLADAFDDRTLWHLVLSWTPAKNTEANDTLFDLHVIQYLLDAGVSVPWTAQYCEAERQRIQPALDAERAREHQAAMDAVSFDTLAQKMAELPGAIQCLQALWDGDTNGWFICLSALFTRGQFMEEKHLAVIKFGTDFRLFNHTVPPWPEAQHAIEVGTALASKFQCAFHFPSPQEPDDSFPPWSP